MLNPSAMAYAPPRKRRPSPGATTDRRIRRRALELLASCGAEGCSEHVLRAHGFTTEQLVEFVRAGLATATPQRTRAGREVLEITTLRITDAGRRVLGQVG
jgi:hypothetical protein